MDSGKEASKALGIVDKEAAKTTDPNCINLDGVPMHLRLQTLLSELDKVPEDAKPLRILDVSKYRRDRQTEEALGKDSVGEIKLQGAPIAQRFQKVHEELERIPVYETPRVRLDLSKYRDARVMQMQRAPVFEFDDDF
jgi:pyrimidine operon attenuation protein/uracil phosphoribosyltransferase